ncbi:MAG: cytochrome-c peroxidase [Flavobacteriales bacterium]
MSVKWPVSFLMLACMACNNSPTLTDEPLRLRIPQGFAPMEIPADNQPTKLRVLLGRKLFYDVRLSAGQNVSCGTCHVASAAFTDGKKVNAGHSGEALDRNTPTIANMAWSPCFMMECGVPTLELQGLAPLHNSHEMATDMLPQLAILNEDEALRDLARAAYQRDSIDPFVVTRALASFQRTLISADSRYDRHTAGLPNQLNDVELLGMQLFFSEKTNCSSCHSGVLFTDFGLYNIGLYASDTDQGLMRKTHLEADHGKFKTPTLRNVELTAPYMHDGSLNTLQDVVAFYNTGGQEADNKDDRIRPLNLTQQEQAALVAFLNSLTDYNFVQNAQFLPLENP